MFSKYCITGLFAVSTILAETNTENFATQNENCCPADCCQPCCSLQPKKCIDCECYTPRFYDLQCAWGIFLEGEFLYWYAKETNLAYAMKVGATGRIASLPATASLLVPKNKEYLHKKWNQGFRLGLGLNSNCDGWDVFASWTRMRNKKENSTSVDNFGLLADEDAFSFPKIGQFALINPWINPGAILFTGSPVTFDEIQAFWQWSLKLIDVELGRKFWLSKCFVMRPFLGIRAGKVKTHFNTVSSRNFSSGVVNIDLFENHVLFKDQFTNRYRGVGLLVGLQPIWYFVHSFALYGDFDTALIWGKSRVEKRERYLRTIFQVDTPSTIIDFEDTLKDDDFLMQSIIDLALGLRWERRWRCDRFLTTLDVGWESHIWFDQNRRFKMFDFFRDTNASPNNSGFRTFDESTGNIVFGGLVVRARVDF